MAVRLPGSFYRKLKPPQLINEDDLLDNDNQVAGHAGLCSWTRDTAICLKPFNLKCARGKREQLFYLLTQHFEDTQAQTLYYRDFPLLNPPAFAANCRCIIDKTLFKSLSNFVPKFQNIKHFDKTSKPQSFDIVTCACYGSDHQAKLACSRSYSKSTFLSIEDLTTHCKIPNIMDIKIGQITYDPMAVKEKIEEQSNKYLPLKDIGFCILGAKMAEKKLDKSFGKSLETRDQVLKALDDFFAPLKSSKNKFIVIQHLSLRLKALIKLFRDVNINQLKFFASSLLIVYDSDLSIEKLTQQVRLSMIDFAHVFHVHSSASTPDECDRNYLFGLEKLDNLFDDLANLHRS